MSTPILTEVLVMEFKDTWDKTRKVKLANPKEDITSDEIESVMNDIADNEFFDRWGTIRPHKAKIVKTEVSEIVTVS